MSFRNRTAFQRRSTEVYGRLSEPRIDPKTEQRRKPSQRSLDSGDLKLSWSKRIWFNMRYVTVLELS